MYRVFYKDKLIWDFGIVEFDDVKFLIAHRLRLIHCLEHSVYNIQYTYVDIVQWLYFEKWISLIS